MELLEFIPDYPCITSETFFQDIYQKKEFYDLRRRRLEGDFYTHQKIIARFMSQWTLYDSLLLIHDTGTGKSSSATAVFDGLVQYRPNMKTLYLSNNDTLLENFKTEILQRSPTLQQRWRQLTKKVDVDEDNFVLYRNRILKEANIECYTYSRFASIVSSSKDTASRTTLIRSYTLGLVILDEVHHLVVRDVEKAAQESSYKDIHQFLHMIPDKKVLLMTATPMRNSPSEIAPLLNLLLPLNEQIPIGDEFLQEYFDIQKQESKVLPVLRWKPLMQQKFRKVIQGYVSVVKQNVDVNVSYQGRILSPMHYFPLYFHTMSDHQTQFYKKAFEHDSKTVLSKSKKAGVAKIDSSFYSHSSQASLMVFPNGKYGLSDTTMYFGEQGKKDRSLNARFFAETKLKRKARTPDEIAYNLDIIRQYSSTYHSIIHHILHHPYELCYVYCDKINGSGILTCIMMLTQCFDFSLLRSPKRFEWKQASRRCIFLNDTEKGTTKTDIPKLIDIFNDERNKYGDFVQVIFGTDKTREGITLKRIQQIHVASPDWNFGKIFQAIGRGVRLLSHEGLGVDVTVNIFFHCTVPDKNMDMESNLLTDLTVDDEEDTQSIEESTEKDPFEEIPTTTLLDMEEGSSSEDQDQDWLSSLITAPKVQEKVPSYTLGQLGSSIDYYKYFRSELRDKNIKLVEYTMLTSAVDCQLNYADNVKRKAKDDTADCMYEACSYRCEGISQIDPPFLDESTYNLFYIEHTIRDVVQEVMNVFHSVFSMNLQDLHRLMTEKGYNQSQLLSALHMILDKPMPILRKDRRIVYLVREGDVFYTLDDRYPLIVSTTSDIGWLQTYTITPSFDVSQQFEQIENEYLLHRDAFVPYFEELLKDRTSNASVMFNRLPPQIKESIVIQVLHILQDPQFVSAEIQSWVEWALEHIFHGTIRKAENDTWEYRREDTTYGLDPSDPNKLIITEFDFLSSLPKQKEKEEQDHDDPEFVRQYITENALKLYAFHDAQKFKIRDVSKDESLIKDLKSKTKGKECTSYSLSYLLSFMWKLGQRFPKETLPSFTKKENERWNKISTLQESEFKALLQKNSLWNQEFTKLQTKIDRELERFFLFYSGHSRHELCTLLKQLFQDANLIVKPPLTKKSSSKKL